MANHPSAQKRHRQILKRELRNKNIRTAMRTKVKKARTAIEAGDAAAAKDFVTTAILAIARSVTQGVLKKNTAARSISRIQIALNKIAS